MLEQDHDAVGVEVVSQRQRGDVAACLDGIEVPRPLDGHDLIDLTSRHVLRVASR